MTNYILEAAAWLTAAYCVYLICFAKWQRMHHAEVRQQGFLVLEDNMLLLFEQMFGFIISLREATLKLPWDWHRDRMVQLGERAALFIAKSFGSLLGQYDQVRECPLGAEPVLEGFDSQFLPGLQASVRQIVQQYQYTVAETPRMVARAQRMLVLTRSCLKRRERKGYRLLGSASILDDLGALQEMASRLLGSRPQVHWESALEAAELVCSRAGILAIRAFRDTGVHKSNMKRIASLARRLDTMYGQVSAHTASYFRILDLQRELDEVKKCNALQRGDFLSAAQMLTGVEDALMNFTRSFTFAEDISEQG